MLVRLTNAIDSKASLIPLTRKHLHETISYHTEKQEGLVDLVM